MNSEDYGLEFVEPELIEWMKNKMISLGFKEELMNKLWLSEEDKLLGQWLSPDNVEEKFLYVIIEKRKDDSYQLDVMTKPFFSGKTPYLFIYFMKEEHEGEITTDNVEQLIYCGYIKENRVLDSLLEIVQKKFAPQLLSQQEWPDSIKKEFSSQIHKFLASLTETANRIKGSTVLYIPNEQISNVFEARKKKDLIQRLETALIKWTSQIKEVVQEKDIIEQQDNESPLSEIEYWRSRTKDLMKLKNQINSPEVQIILEVLKNSSYLPSFTKLAGEIQKGFENAKDNLKFLATLTKSCKRLSTSKPTEIEYIVPEILKQITMIWNLSNNYHTSERITGLLKKVSNEIISRCCASINLDDIFGENISKGISSLRNSIEAGKKWKEICTKRFKHLKQHYSKFQNRRKFSYDSSSVFAEVDAFVHRCHDLIDVAKSQLQLGDKANLPHFGGSRGTEIIKSLYDIRVNFTKLLNNLRNIDYPLLDVKSTAWHDDYGKFKSGVRDLELIMDNVLSSAFDSIRTIQDAVELLEGFNTLAKREHIKNVIQIKTGDLYNFFYKQLDKVQSVFDRKNKNPPIKKHHPRFAGSALWAENLRKRILKDKDFIDKAYFLQTEELSKEKKILDKKFNHLYNNVLSHYMTVIYDRWRKSIDVDEILEVQNRPVMKRLSNGLLNLNINRKLLLVYKEYRCWEKISGFEPPPRLVEAIGSVQDEEKLRIHMENVNLLVRSYNEIRLTLKHESEEEENSLIIPLFSDRIRILDKKIFVGISNLYWSNHKGIEYFVNDSMNACKKINREINFFIEKRFKVIQKCNEISKTQLIEIDPKVVYTEKLFIDTQKRRIKNAKKILVEINEEVIGMMKELYNIFQSDPKTIHEYWWDFVEIIEERIDKVLRQSLKIAFNCLSDSINGTKKSGDTQNPLFFVNVEMCDSEATDKKTPILNPSVEDLEKLIESTLRDLKQCIQVVVCLRPALQRIIKIEIRNKKIEEEGEGEIEEEEDLDLDEDDLLNYSDSISKDPSFREPMVKAYQGIKDIDEAIKKHLFENWTKQFEKLWRSDKDIITKRLMFKNRASNIFEEEYQNFSYFNAGVKKKPHSKTIGYLQLDFSNLKAQISEQANLMMKTVLEVLHTQAKKGLNNIYNVINDYTRQLQEPIKEREVLKKKLELLEKCKEEIYKEGDEDLQEGEVNKNKSQLEKKFVPIRSHYTVLKKYAQKKYEKKLLLKEEELNMLDNLDKVGKEFENLVRKADIRITSSKEDFKIKLQHQIATYEKTIFTLEKDLKDKGPFDAKYSVQDAENMIREFRKKLQYRVKQQQKLKNGSRMFQIQMKNYKEIKEINKQLTLLEKIWNLKKDWDITWGNWKIKVFKHLDVKSMKKKTADFIKNTNYLGRDCENWGIWHHLTQELYKFKNTLPLIMDLKNEAMRQRHWEDLYERIPAEFDHNGENFNLEKIIELNFESYSEEIRSISNAARQELNIERGLEKISENWKNLYINVVPFRDIHLKIVEVEDIFQTLDDDSAIISVMKLNPFITSFVQETNEWEKTLSQISEILETLMKVQEIWLYLLNIFEVDDIQKQLPSETSSFKVVNNRWRTELEIFEKEKTVLKCCSRRGLLDDLKDMIQELESIQKQLDDYLEIKRQEFPRFYFLSDRDLLEILGQSKNPAALQRHLKNCFEGIHELQIEEYTEPKKKGFIGIGVNSREGEYMSLLKNVFLEGPVEKWLFEVEKSMRYSVKKHLKTTYTELSTKRDRERWIKKNLGQLIILSSQLSWTQKVEETLKKLSSGKGKKNSLKDLARKTCERNLKKYIKIIRKKLDPLTREKLIALVTIEVHQKDVIEILAKNGVNRSDDFLWEKQLRFYLDDEAVKIRQTSSEIDYDNEYIGPTSRLVITPLTERCYMTLTTAIHLSRGGNPKGPAGTGKTETVKDLSKNIGKYCIVFNCSKGLDINSMARMFSGLVQTGAWSCFDEFNRIEIEVLSVVAQQIGKIIETIISKSKNFHFEGKEIPINPTCGIFCTMNPGYAGRTELPDNLKALLRPIAMMKADASLICEIFLFAQGFSNSRNLSKKIVTLYELMKQQLSKQKHYDFGLRAVKAVLTAAGDLKRVCSDNIDEESVLLQACREMNIPKFVADDLPLFKDLLGDLFPGIEPMEKDLGILEKGLLTSLEEQGLKKNDYIISKAVELFNTKKTRHGNMVVGKTNSGKSTAWKTLQKTLNTLNKKHPKEYPKVKSYVINPKALNNEELYGFYTKSREWKNGVLSVIMKESCKDTTDVEKWILFDGPVDTYWIESMNTVLDDTKTLTLISGERIGLSKTVSLLFEVQDLSSASPATVSRCGMVFFDENGLGWVPLFNTWVSKKLVDIENEEEKKKISNMYITFLSFVERALYVKNQCEEIIPTNPVNLVKSLFNLYDSLINNPDNIIVNSGDIVQYCQTLQKYFVFSTIWSIGGTVNKDGRKKLDMLFREFDPNFPSKDTVYEYYIDEKSKNWTLWEERIMKNWKPNNNDYFTAIVPTVDTTRNTYVINSLLRSQKDVLVVGEVGTGKTSIVKNILNGLDENKFTSTIINFSARTSSKKLQQIIETKIEKKSFDTYAPISGKRLIVFIDDFNMPQKDDYGSQPPLELIRQWIDYKFWYDRNNQSVNKIQNVQLISSMGPPGGGREEISPRLQSKFNIINFTFPKDMELKRIFTTLLKHRLDKLEEMKLMVDNIVNTTIDLYRFVTETFRPTPNKSHYLFNLRDLSKVFQGILHADHENMDTSQQMEKLWVHECHRVFYDRLVDKADRKRFKNEIENVLLHVFETKWSTLFYRSKIPYPFGTIIKENYSEMKDKQKLTRQINHQLFCYNNELGVKPMKLVLFTEAIDHICRISRILNQPRGNALLIGVGGSGRSSLTRLASYLSHFDVFEIEITNNYGLKEFRDSLKDLYKKCGFQGKDVVFLIKDTQFVEDYFLEDINTMLNSGEVPNLFEPEELDEIYDHCKADATMQGYDDNKSQVYDFFLEKVKKHLHFVICMSPVGSSFRRRIRMFPALVSSTTIDWFDEWPKSALKEVAYNFLKDIDFSNVKLLPESRKKDGKNKPLKKDEEEEEEEKKEDISENISEVFVTIHESVREQSTKMLKELKRINYVTPTNYLELVTGYIDLLKEKKKKIGDECKKLEKGVFTLEKSRTTVLEMKVELAKQKEDVAAADSVCEKLMRKIVEEQEGLNEKKEQVKLKSSQIENRKLKLEKVEQEAARELEKVRPELEKAKTLVTAIDANDILELRSYQNPPKNVEMVLVSVMLALNKKPTYEEAKAMMVKPGKFLSSIVNYDHKKMTNKMLTKMKKITSQQKFRPDIVRKSSHAIADLCQWFIAVENYGRVWKIVKPKKDKLESAQASLNNELDRLREAQNELDELNKNLKKLEDDLERKREEKKRITDIKENTEKKLSLAKQLVEALKDERERWTKNILDYKNHIGNLPGDVLLASAFISYCGPFNNNYRENLYRIWRKSVKQHRIPSSSYFEPKKFLINEVDIQSWVIQGLPSDKFSGENGALVTRGRRFPLMIDPQGQANRWIKNFEKENDIEVTNFKKDNFLRNLENAIVYGRPVLIEDVPEDIEPSYYSIIGKQLYKKGNRTLIKLGDKELDFNPNFKLYLTTKIGNPHFKPEISTKTTIVNFSVTKGGLEEQLLVTVVKKENPDLENQKKEIVNNVAEGKKTMVKLEDDILHQITTAKDLLAEEIIETLKLSKQNSEKIKKQLVKNKETERKIDNLRNFYRSAAVRASILYFVICDLSTIDPMYQFSLEKYIELFENSIENSDKPKRREQIKERVKMLNEYHTYEVYRTTCQALFEKDKLLFSFQLCSQILLEKGEIDKEEFNFFLRGGVVIDKESQMVNPCEDWLPEVCWDNFFELDKLVNFHELVKSLEESAEEWYEWYKSESPESHPLPSEWQSKVGYWEKMMLVRCCREDRLISMIKHFITERMNNDKYVKPPTNNLALIYSGSTPFTPFIFILNQGVDPGVKIQKFAAKKDKKLNTLALGQNQELKATRLIQESCVLGEWVFLANCHLMMSWMPELEKLIDELPNYYPQENFRLFLSSKPHPKFPISILQKSRKITLEPSTGIPNNMIRLFNEINEEKFNENHLLKKSLFSLAFYHSTLLERAKFGTLGWNVIYDFNDSDFLISKDILHLYLQKTEVNWNAIRFLIGDISYGGRVTDDNDRKLLNIYTNSCFNEKIITENLYQLTTSDVYYKIPRDTLNFNQSIKYIEENLPVDDEPIAFGQHFNADISSRIQNSSQLLNDLVLINPQPLIGEFKKKPEDFVKERAISLLKDKTQSGIPENINLELAKHTTSALNTVLLQESTRYNNLLDIIRTSLEDLIKAINGDIVMNNQLEEIFNDLYEGRVPSLWMKTYPSMKNIAGWIRDLQKRIKQMKNWAEGEEPKVFWISGFIFPTGFLTALKQSYARQKNISIDQLQFEFLIMGMESITTKPKEGAYISGLLLEGAGWDNENSRLCEPTPMKLLTEMPIIWFKPIVVKKKQKMNDESKYSCPVYYYPKRSRKSFVINVDLRLGNSEKQHWIKRGTALLLSDGS